MVNNAYIKIWDQLVGAIAWDAAQGMAFFEFDPKFRMHEWDLAPLKMPIAAARGSIFSFPELIRSNTFKGLPGLLADVLPDKYGNRLINEWLIKQGRSMDSMNPVELLCFIGKRGMGALEFEPVIQDGFNTATKIEVGQLIETAQSILSNKKQFNTKLASKSSLVILYRLPFILNACWLTHVLSGL